MFVIAAGQIGRHPPDDDSYGHSMIVDPWGEVLAARRRTSECFVAADLDLDAPGRGAREAAVASRTASPRAYRWPEEVDGRDGHAPRRRAPTSGA